jgi:WD40 repeat protein
LPTTCAVTTALAIGDGSSLLTGSSDGQVAAIDLAGSKEPQRVTAFAAPVAALAANAQRSLVVAASTGGDVAVIDPKERSAGATLSAGSLRAVAVHPQQPKFATAGEDGLIRLWNVPQPPQELAAHKAPVGALAVSPDGKQAASGDASGTVRRWSLPEGKDAGELTGGKEPVRAAVYRRDSQELATGDAAGVVRLFSTTEGTALGTIGAHDGPITGLSYHPNHTQLLSSGADGILRLWQLPLVPPREVSKLAGQVRAMATSSDGNTLVVAGEKSVRIVDATNNQERAAIEATSAVTAAAVSPDNAQAAFVTEAGTLHVAALVDGKPIADLGAHIGAVTAVAFRPQAGQLATAGSDGQLRLWELPATPRTFSDHTGRITAVAVSPNGQLLATASADKTVRLWNLADGSASWTLGHDEVVTAIAWKPDSSQVAAAAGKQVRIWNMADGQQAAALDKFTGNIAAVVFAPDGASVYAAGAAQTIQQWNLADGALLRTLGDHDKPIQSLTLVAGGATLISASQDGAIRAWNLATGARAMSINHGGAPTALAASSDGKWLAVAGPQKSIQLYDLADGGIAQTITLTAATDCLAFSGDNLSLAGGSADGNARIWNLQGQLQEFVPSADNAPTALAFLPDHRQLVVGGQKNLVRVHRRALVKALPVSQSPLTALAWSADGQFVLTGASDKTLKLWNVTDGTMARQFFGQADVPRSIAITKDGTKAIAGCDDKSLRVWNYSDANLLATLLLESAPRVISVSADGARIAAAEKTTLRVWDLASQRTSERFDLAATALAILPDGKGLLAGDTAGITRRLTLAGAAIAIAHSGAAASATINNDGQKWLSAGSDKTVKAWDPAGKPLATLGSTDGAPAALAMRPDGLQIAVAGADRQIHLWRLDNNQLERKIPAGSAIISLAYHPTLPRLAAVCADGKIRVYGPADGMLLEIVPAAKTQAIAFAGDRLLSAHADHALRLHTSSLERIVPGHQGAVTTLVYAADGNSLFSGGVDNTVRQWNTADGAAVRTVATAGGPISGLVLSPDGTRLLAASTDKTIRVHNVADGAAVSTINSPAAIRSLAIDAGGRLLAGSGDDGPIRVWDAKTGALNETLAGATTPATAVLFSSDLQVIAALGEKSLSVWPLACRTIVSGDATKIHDLAATPDGKQLVTSGEDKIVKLWDAAGMLVRVFPGSPFPLRSVAVRPDGAQLIAGGDPGQSQPQLWAWNLADAQLQFNVNLPAAISRVMYLDAERIAVACADQKVRVLKASDGKLLEEVALPAAATAIAPAGNSLVAASADNLIRPVQPALVQVIAAHEGGAAAVAWSAGGETLFSAGADKLVRQWDAATGKPVRTLAGLSAPATSLALAADGKTVLACCGDQQVQVWELAEKASAGDAELQPARAVAYTAPVRSVAISRGGTRIVAGSDDGLVRVIDAKTAKEVERFAGHTGAVPAVAISGDGRIVISGGADRAARRFEPSIAATAAAPSALSALLISADGKQVLAGGNDGKVTAWSAADLAHIRDYAGAALPIRSLATSPQGDLLAAGGDDAHLRIWSATEGTLLADVNTHAPISALSFAAGGSLVVVTNADGILRHYELTRSEGKLTLAPFLVARGHTGSVRGLVVSADGSLAVSVGADSRLVSWRITAGKPRWSRPLGMGPIHDAAFRPDGKELAAAAPDGQLHVLNTEDGTTLRQWKGHDGPVLAVAWRADGQELASAGREDAIRIWNLEGKEAAKIAVSGGGVQALGWSPDGGLLQAAGRSKLWHTFQRANQQSVREAQGHNHPIVALRYSASGQRLATLDDSGKLFVWDAAGGTPLFHQQLPVAAAYRLAWSPDASEVFVATSDPRVLRAAIPATAR